jgi:hypothetical protein
MDDFVTWSTDPSATNGTSTVPACGQGCPSSEDYKRITVVVTMSGEASPSPVYVSSLIVDPNAAPADGTANGTTGNPVSNGDTSCATSTGTTTTQGTCESPIDSGTPNTFILHDCAATTTTPCSSPSGSGPLHDTVGLVTGLTGTLTCSTSTVLGFLTADDNGCPAPDLMDQTVPSGTSTTPLYQYSTDVGSSGYIGGRLLEPLCGTGAVCGTGKPSDCNGAVSWTSSLMNLENELWVTEPLSANTTLTGEGALNLYTQTQNGTNAIVTLCLELYEIPPSDGIAGSVANLLAWPPTALGGAGYVAATDPSTGSNWPTSPTDVEYEFNYATRGATVPSGDRIGVRVWMVANVGAAIALIYDNPTYPSEIQLNSTTAIQLGNG